MTATGGFDITQEGGVLAALQPPGEASSTLYQVFLAPLAMTGAGTASPLGAIGDTEPLRAFALRLTTAPDAEPAPDPDAGDDLAVIDLDAGDNVDAAIALSRLAFGDGAAPQPGGEPAARTALLARDDVFADSLASGGAQGALGAPLLLTPQDALDPRVEAELERLQVDVVQVLGGEDAIAPAVAQRLQELGYEVQRLAGATRVETAVAVARALVPDADAVVLARAFGGPDGDETQAFADALGGGAYAARARQPVLLTDTGALSDATATYLTEAGVDHVLVLGGVGAVSEAVVDEVEALGITVRRAGASNRFATAVALLGVLGIDDVDDVDVALVTEGQSADAWASGFAAASIASRQATAFVLSNGDALPPETDAFLQTGTAPTLVCAPYAADAACAAAQVALTTDG